MRTIFKPCVSMLQPAAATVDVNTIKQEPMLYGATWQFARANGGILTQGILGTIRHKVADLIEDQAAKGYHPVIDTKVCMLMPGWYPSIPGWHCDGVKRDTPQSQPDLSTVNEGVFHFVSSISSADICPTEILVGNIEVDVDKTAVWKSVDASLGNPEGALSLRSGQIAMFNRATLHRCTPATQRGWRFFFRLSFYHMPAMNEIRNQVQVYTDVNQGW